MRDLLQIDPIIKKIKSIEFVDEINYQGNLIRKIERTFKKLIIYHIFQAL